RTESSVDRILGTSTVIVNDRRDDRPPFVIADIRRGAQLAAVLELLASESGAASDNDAIRAALAWEPRAPAAYRASIGAVSAGVSAIGAVAIGLHGRPLVTRYAPDDAIRPGGVKRSTAEIARFMEHDVMPWARAVLGRIKGGADWITCETCHAADAEARDWQ